MVAVAGVGKLAQRVSHRLHLGDLRLELGDVLQRYPLHLGAGAVLVPPQPDQVLDALAAADVGIAMATGTDVAMHTAGVTLMRGDPVLVGGSIDVSRRTYAKIKQGLFWAFAYNVIGIPLAALGYLSPVLAGAAMALSSVSVVLNALTLRGWKPRGL